MHSPALNLQRLRNLALVARNTQRRLSSAVQRHPCGISKKRRHGTVSWPIPLRHGWRVQRPVLWSEHRRERLEAWHGHSAKLGRERPTRGCTRGSASKAALECGFRFSPKIPWGPPPPPPTHTHPAFNIARGGSEVVTCSYAQSTPTRSSGWRSGAQSSGGCSVAHNSQSSQKEQ
jgi:hypothetical protein